MIMSRDTGLQNKHLFCYEQVKWAVIMMESYNRFFYIIAMAFCQEQKKFTKERKL